MVRERLMRLVEEFREKGATSPDKALTVEELGLPPRFRYLMNRRLGKRGIFLEVNGKYYLSEEKLRQIEEQRSRRRIAGDSRKKLFTLRIVRIVTGILFVTLLLANLFIESMEIRLMASFVLVVLIGISILQLYYLTKTRRRISSNRDFHMC